METFALLPHPDSPAVEVDAVEARISITDPHWLSIRWKIARAMSATLGEAGVPWMPAEALHVGQRFQALNPGVAVGRLRVVAGDDVARVGAGGVGVDDILILDELPLDLPIVAGTITTRPRASSRRNAPPELTASVTACSTSSAVSSGSMTTSRATFAMPILISI